MSNFSDIFGGLKFEFVEFIDLFKSLLEGGAYFTYKLLGENTSLFLYVILLTLISLGVILSNLISFSSLSTYILFSFSIALSIKL